MSFQPCIDPCRPNSNRTSSADARASQLAALACGVDRVPAQACVLRSLGNIQPGLHGAPRSTRVRVFTTVAERPCEWRALARWPKAQRAWNSGARCGLMLPASKTGTLSVAVVARHVVMRPEASGSHWPRCSLEWPGDTATPRWCTAAACPEGDAVCGCESLISKWLCERSRFRTVLKSGSGLSVVALRAVTFSAPRRMILSRRVCSKHGR